jgi:hypothetical protein
VPDDAPRTPALPGISPTATVSDAIQTATHPVASLVVAQTGEDTIAPTERRVSVVRLPVANASDGPANTDTASKAAYPVSPPRVVVSADPRPTGQHPNDSRSVERRLPQPGETHVHEERIADNRSPITLPQPRATMVATASHLPVADAGGATSLVASPALATLAPTSHLPAPVPVQTPARAPFGGSLLGMAHGSTAPQLPRPTPINATQLYNSN